MKLGKKNIGAEYKPFIIAEMSGNHNNSLERALEMVDIAAKNGADALKLQTYTPDTMTLNSEREEFVVNGDGNLWKGQKLYDLYQEAMTPWEWHKPIMQRCEELGLEFFSTPFDDTAVDFLEELGVDFYKVASFENTHIPLLQKIGSTKKPVIISSGMASLDELALAVETLREAGSRDIIVLKCTSAYPAKPEHANLKTLPIIKDSLDVEIGVSDHTMGLAVPITAVALGATVIEKHFTIKRSDGGVDSAFSLEPEELLQLSKETEFAWKALGQVKFGCSSNDAASKKYKRSIYVSQDIKAGEKITKDNIKIVRPALGLAPKFYSQVLGRIAKHDINFSEPLTWDDI